MKKAAAVGSAHVSLQCNPKHLAPEVLKTFEQIWLPRFEYRRFFPLLQQAAQIQSTSYCGGQREGLGRLDPRRKHTRCHPQPLKLSLTNRDIVPPTEVQIVNAEAAAEMDDAPKAWDEPLDDESIRGVGGTQNQTVTSMPDAAPNCCNTRVKAEDGHNESP